MLLQWEKCSEPEIRATESVREAQRTSGEEGTGTAETRQQNSLGESDRGACKETRNSRSPEGNFLMSCYRTHLGIPSLPS